MNRPHYKHCSNAANTVTSYNVLLVVVVILTVNYDHEGKVQQTVKLIEIDEKWNYFSTDQENTSDLQLTT